MPIWPMQYGGAGAALDDLAVPPTDYPGNEQKHHER